MSMLSVLTSDLHLSVSMDRPLAPLRVVRNRVWPVVQAQSNKKPSAVDFSGADFKNFRKSKKNKKVSVPLTYFRTLIVSNFFLSQNVYIFLIIDYTILLLKLLVDRERNIINHPKKRRKTNAKNPKNCVVQWTKS